MNNKSYFTGIIGALIGGFIAAIPWVLMYVYGNMILSLLAIIIALGALKGYQLFNGKVDKKLPVFITVVSLIVVTISTFVLIPYLLILKENTSVSISYLYQNSDFTIAILKDYFISLLFTIIGISGVITSIKSQVNNKKEKIDVHLFRNSKVEEEDILFVKNVFAKYNAFDKNTTIAKEDVLKEITKENKEEIFNNLVLSGNIRQYKNKYYFVENGTSEKVKKVVIIVSIVIIVFSLIVGLILSIGSNDKMSKVSNSFVSYNYDNSWNEYLDSEEENYYIYVPKIDETGYSGIISVSYGYTTYLASDYELMKQEIIKSFEEEGEVFTTTDLNTEKGYSALLVEIAYDDPKSFDKLYYILTDNKYALVYSTDYYVSGVNVDEVALEMVNSLTFTK
ncbi:MAG: hypothetical protein PUC23_00890 [bacterium]|nr:hypothetical protein [bacterium]